MNAKTEEKAAWWVSAKVSILIFWFPSMLLKLWEGGIVNFPSGIYRLIDLEPLFHPIGKCIISFTLLVVCIIYLFEKKMLFTTFLMFIFSILIISYQESKGIYARATVYSLVFLGQWFAYLVSFLKGERTAEPYRVEFSVQMVAAGYTLAGIAKFRASGIEWVEKGPYFGVQVIKNFSYLYSDSGDISFLERGYSIANWLVEHEVLSIILLSIALCLELFCFLVLLNERLKLLWGIGLIFLHSGIAILMGIGFSSIFFPMLVYFINPLYLIRLSGQRLGDWLRKRKVFFI